MIGLDTNVLVRYLAQDDAEQSLLATHLIESLTVDEPGCQRRFGRGIVWPSASD